MFLTWSLLAFQFLGVVLSCGCAPGRSAATRGSEVGKAHYEKGSALFAQGQHERARRALAQALGEYQKALAADQDDAELFYGRALCYVKSGQVDMMTGDYAKAADNYARAAKDVGRAIELKPAHAEAYYTRGELHHRSGQFEKAIDDFSKAVALKPDYGSAYANRGVDLYNSGDYDKAASDLAKALSFRAGFDHKTIAYLHFMQGNALDRTGRYDKAIESFTKAIELNSDYVGEAYNDRGRVYEKLGRTEDARKDREKADSFPGMFNVHYNNGVMSANAGEYDKAVAEYTRAIALKPDYIAAYYNRGTVYLQTGQLNDAVKDFTAIITMKPDNAEAYQNRGTAFDRLERPDKAKEDFTKAGMLRGKSLLKP